MKKNFIYLYTVICISCFSCASSFKLGRYNEKNDSGYYNDFTFFEDSTFSYNHYGYTHQYKHSSGKYRVIDDRVILNSDIIDTTIPIDVSILSNDSLIGKNRIIFRFNPMKEDQKNYKVIPVINKDSLNYNRDAAMLYIAYDILVDDKWGTYTEYYTKPIDSVRLVIVRNPFLSSPGKQYDPIETKTMYFDKVTGKNITFNLTIKDSLFGYRIFNNTVLNIKRNKILFVDEEEGKKHTLNLRKD